MQHPGRRIRLIRAIFYKQLKRARTSLFSTLVRFRVRENTFMAVLAVIIGLLSGLCNFAFRKSILFFNWLIIDNGSAMTGFSTGSWDISRLAAIAFPITGAVLMIPIIILFREDISFGFPRFLESVNLRGGKLKPRQILTRGLASAITIGSGGSAGQEGPIAQIGGTVGSLFGQLLRFSEGRMKILIGCGVSGGIAATFNAPIAGVFFAHEIVLLSTFELTSFTSIVISSGISTVVSRALFGNMPVFSVPAYEMNHSIELVFYAFLGLALGFLAATFITMFCKIRKFFAGLSLHPLLKPCLGATLTGLIAVFLPQILGNGYQFVEKIMINHYGWLILTFLIAAKMLATCTTIGSGLPGGLFAPILFIGAAAGGSFGFLVKFLFASYASTPGEYALVGMGAFLAAVTNAPMTGIFLLFEMTNSYQIIVPIMLSCVLGTSIARYLVKEGIDTIELAEEGIELREGKEQNLLKELKVKNVMNSSPVILPESMSLRRFAGFIATTRHTSFPLVNYRQELTGMISIHDFLEISSEEELLDLVVLKELAEIDIGTVTPDDSLAQAMDKISLRDFELLPVVDPGNRKKVIGVLSRRDMIAAYNKAIMEKSLKGL
ncbi:MAG TPA: chloride channel protein [Geobacteraceae bacterium]|nr:chloride channel protein [Geobacteraceae bacterium]